MEGLGNFFSFSFGFFGVLWIFAVRAINWILNGDFLSDLIMMMLMMMTMTTMMMILLMMMMTKPKRTNCDHNENNHNKDNHKKDYHTKKTNNQISNFRCHSHFYHGLLPARQSHGHGASCLLRGYLNSERLHKNRQKTNMSEKGWYLKQSSRLSYAFLITFS